MTDLEDKRDELQLARLEPDIAALIDRGRKHPEWPKVIFFPGGLSSELYRARAPGGPQPSFAKLWISPRLLLEENVELLAMKVDEDVDTGIIVPHGTIKICVYDPYKSFVSWCGDSGINLLVLGYDWRRRPNYAVTFFLEKFLPHLEQKFSRAGLSESFKDFTLLGHSLGGPLIKLILQDDHPRLSIVTRAITVAAPFYGYGGHTRHYFEGLKEFFWCGKSHMARMIASLRGGYFLQFLDSETYRRNAKGFKDDTEYALHEYPSKDPDTKSNADPFPESRLVGQRYPAYVATDELPLAKDVVQKIAADLPDHFKDRFFCMRGVQTDRHDKATDGTIVSQTWRLVEPGFNPDKDKSPLSYQNGPGDGTQPAWTARHLKVATFTYRGNLEHSRMMDFDGVRSDLLKLIRAPDVRRFAGRNVKRNIGGPDLNLMTATKEDTIIFLGRYRELYQRGRSGEGAINDLLLAEHDNLEKYGRRLHMMLLGSDIPPPEQPGRRAIRRQ